MKRVKQRVFEVLCKAEKGDKLSHVFDMMIMVLILLSVLSIILESYDRLDNQYGAIFDVFEAFMVIIFSLEYLARIWTAPLLYPYAKHPRLKYIFSIMALIDLLAILPFYLPIIDADLRFLRMIRLFRMARLLRVLKFSRYMESVHTISRILKESATQLIASVVGCFVVMLFASILMYSVESQAQPDAFPNVIAALWWAVCTLTTVGYGDVYPITDLGRILASVMSLIGIGIVAIPTGIISAGFITVLGEKEAKAHDEITHCPYCGHKLKE